MPNAQHISHERRSTAMTADAVRPVARLRRPWIGAWLMAVAVIHFAAAVAQNTDVLRAMVDDGLFNSIPDHPDVGAVMWSLLFGVIAFVGGLAVLSLERAGTAIPTSIGWILLAVAVLGTFLAPVSGFWLLAPPVVAILIGRRRRSLG